LIDPPVLVFLAVFWGIGLAIPGYRTNRFLTLLAIATTLVVVAELLAPRVRDIVRLAVVVVVGAGAVFAERFGLASMTVADLRVDRAVARARQLAASSAESRRQAVAILDGTLESDLTDDRWRPGLRALRRAWSRGADGDRGHFLSPTPSNSYSLAAERLLFDAVTSKTLGVKRKSGKDEKSIALRAYLDDVRLAMPSGPIGDPSGPAAWKEGAEVIIAEMRRLPIDDARVSSLRNRLADMLNMEVNMRVTGPTAADQGAYDQLAAEVDEAWTELDA
jgi:hypothetical protein